MTPMPEDFEGVPEAQEATIQLAKWLHLDGNKDANTPAKAKIALQECLCHVDEDVRLKRTQGRVEHLAPTVEVNGKNYARITLHTVLEVK